MNRNYQNGRAAEYRVVKILEATGYTAVRSAGSHGCADVIAWNTQGLRLIQVKRGVAHASPLEWAAFAELPVPYGTVKEIWEFRKPRHPPVVRVVV